MSIAFRPVAFSTAFSLALHAGLAAVFLLQQPDIMQATGQGVAIELVSSNYQSDQEQTERASSPTNSPVQAPAPVDQHAGKVITTNAVTTVAQAPAAAQVADDLLTHKARSAEPDSGDGAITASTRASAHDSTIVELLHSSISLHKQYPYLAIRQRREGVVRVAFVLHPDGAIDDARLIQSSRTRILDKAALDAVKRIEPFKLAKDYLEKPEAFQVDVVFNVM
jgi:TonB family protein